MLPSGLMLSRSLWPGGHLAGARTAAAARRRGGSRRSRGEARRVGSPRDAAPSQCHEVAVLCHETDGVTGDRLGFGRSAGQRLFLELDLFLERFDAPVRFHLGSNEREIIEGG